MYRERDKLYPILVRHVERERRLLPGTTESLQVAPTLSSTMVPLGQVTRGRRVEPDEATIWRFNRRRTITVQSNPPDGVNASALRDSVLDDFTSFASGLPPGYSMEWGGEHESSLRAQASLVPGMVPAAVLIALIVVALFNAYRPPLIILITVPFVAIGITVGLLVARQPFGFVALLGAMSLSGMMIKNAIVLLDQVVLELATGKTRYQAVVDSAVSRLRPVLLAAATTVLGVAPLLQDVFWRSMAVTIMSGLAFGSLLIMVLVPVFYALLYRLR